MRVISRRRRPPSSRRRSKRKIVKYKFKVTAVALANKLARIVYALATKGGHYDDCPVVA